MTSVSPATVVGVLKVIAAAWAANFAWLNRLRTASRLRKVWNVPRLGMVLFIAGLLVFGVELRGIRNHSACRPGSTGSRYVFPRWTAPTGDRISRCSSSGL